MQYQIEEDCNTYGVQYLVDFRPIEEADKLLLECEKFVQETKAEALLVPFVPSFALIANNIRSWRMKRRESRLSTTYIALQPRIAAAEKTLRSIIGEVVEKKTVLRLQARQLLVRLEECAKYNKELLRSTDLPLEETRTCVNVLSSESSSLKTMITFNKEVLRIKNAQEMNKSPALLRWGMQKANRTAVDVDVSKDTEHLLIDQKLLQFRELRQKFVDYLGAILEKRGVQQSNLDNCLWSLDAIRAAIKRDGFADSQEDIALGKKGFDISFDHNRCVDCSYGYSITCECMSHLSTLQKQAQDANKRLQALVEVRERMLEAAEILMNQQQADGTRSSFSWNPSSPSYEDSTKVSNSASDQS